MKKIFLLTLLLIGTIANSQNQKTNSDTRKFIDGADFTQVNRDWNLTAEFKSGLGESVSFFPVEVIDLKTNTKIHSIQVDMTVKSTHRGNDYDYFKSSWIDLNEVEELIIFLRKYVIPNLDSKTGHKESTTYIFNSKEIIFTFLIEKNTKRISIYLKDGGVTDFEHYFWTQSQADKIPSLLNVLKAIK